MKTLTARADEDDDLPAELREQLEKEVEATLTSLNEAKAAMTKARSVISSVNEASAKKDGVKKDAAKPNAKDGANDSATKSDAKADAKSDAKSDAKADGAKAAPAERTAKEPTAKGENDRKPGPESGG